MRARKKNSPRSTSDVIKTARSRTGKIWNDRATVNLGPSLARKYWYMALVLAIIIAASAFWFYGGSTRAESADFYPSSCLGDWSDTVRAQGIPESFSSDDKIIEEESSAVYKGGEQGVFCGQFLATEEFSRGTIESVGVTFVWRVGEQAGTVESVTPTENSPSSEPISPTPDETTPDPVSWFFSPRSVFAQESETESVPETPQAESESEFSPEPILDGEDKSKEVIPLGPPLEAPLTPLEEIPESDEVSEAGGPATSSSDQASSTDPALPAIVSPVIDERFLGLYYRTDSSEWIELARVSANTLPHFTTALPLAQWEELAALQIKVAGISTSANPVPSVYLDGMVVEVQHKVDVKDGEEIEEASEEVIDELPKPSGKFLLDTTTSTLSGAIHVSAAPPGSAIEIYVAEESQENPVPANVYGALVGEDGTVEISAQTLQPGRYILVNTFEANHCGGFSIEECRSRSDYLGEEEIVITEE